MSKVLQQALVNYKAGRFDLVASQLGSAIKGSKSVEAPVALLMAQSCFKLGQLADAASWYERAAPKAGDKIDQISLLAANLYWRLRNTDKTMALARAMLARNARNMDALAILRACQRFLLLFDAMEASDAKVLPLMQAGDAAMLAMEKPLDNIFWCADETINARITRMDEAVAYTPASQAARRAHPHRFSDRIRIGYLSNDVSDQHATMRLIQGVFMGHDRTRFDVTVFCHTDEGVVSTDRGMRERYDRLVRIGHLSDREAVALIRSMEIDILVDLKGHTKDARLSIMNMGAAPVQVAYLGFPGFTTGIDCDYIIGDAIVTPEESKALHPPKLCRLPESYQANDNTWRALTPAAARADLGLPQDAIVFASFNSTLKITRRTFDLWMQILSRVEGSVLWMLCEHPAIRENLTAEALRGGISADRLIFADRAAYPEHVARLQAADIGLDTFPCNGHTTTSDKLWAGLPLVTMRGTNFSSRVSESLLLAAGLPELVTDGPDDYVDLCVRLASDRVALSAIRQTLSDNRFRAPLFDTERFTRHLEQAFERMIERARAGLGPDHIDIQPLPPRTQPFTPLETRPC